MTNAPVQEMHHMALSLKAAYDNMNVFLISQHFQNKAQFQGTGEAEYRTVNQSDVAEYFKNIFKTRKSSNLALYSTALNGNVLTVSAAFQGVANDGSEIDKPVTLEMTLVQGGEKLFTFKSTPVPKDP